MKTDKIQKEIEKRNKLWKSASAAQRRVLIAKDVIAQLKIGRIKARRQAWVIPNRTTSIGADFQQELLNGLTCEACGIGSCFISAALFKDKVKMVEMDEGNMNWTARYSGISVFPEGSQYDTVIESDEKDTVGIIKIFGKRQLKLIEIAFEQGRGLYSKDCEFFDKEECRAQEFGNRYKNDKNRLVAIMKNIAANSGKFIP